MSSKTKLFYGVLFAILLIISLKSAMAVQSPHEGFNAYAQNKILYSCACSGTENIITVENTGEVTSAYEINQSGEGAAYSAVSQETFTLKPGESRELHNFISAPCNRKGKFDLITTISTAFGTAKQIEQTIDIRKCVNVDIKQTRQPEEICPCMPVRYDFTVMNTGDFVETYNINVAPFPEYISISEDLLVLGPGKSEEVYVFVATPCGMFGDLDFTLMAEAQRSGMLAELPFELKINPCYDYTISSPESVSVCRGVRNVLPITVSNDADVANSYFLDADAEWAFFEQGAVSLGKKQSTSTNLTLYPSSAPEGMYNLTISSVSERGELRVSKSMNVGVEECYSVNLTIDAVPPLASCEEHVTEARIINDGTRESEYSLELFGMPWSSLGYTSIRVPPGDSKDVPVKLDVPCNATGTYEFTVSANISGFPEKIVQKTFASEVIPLQEAYAVNIGGEKDEIDIDYSGKNARIMLSSTGIRAGEYDIVLNTTQDWITTRQNSIELSPGESRHLNISIYPTNETEEGTYGFTLTAVPEGKNIGYERAFSIELREKTFFEKLADLWIFIVPGLLLIIILALALLMAARKRSREEEEWKEIEGEPSKVEPQEPEEKLLDVEERKRPWLKWLLIILGILILLGAIGAGAYLLAGAPAEGINETNATTQEAPELQEPAMNDTNAAQGFLSKAWSWLSGRKNETTEDRGMIENATIYVNRTGLRGEGRVIEVRGKENITIPVTIQNNYEPNVFKVDIREDVEWISVDRQSAEIAPGEKETVNIIVAPGDEVSQGNYRISIRIDVEGRTTPISEEIILKVTKDKPFYMKYLWYLIAAAALLALLAAASWVKGWREKRKQESLEMPTEKEKKDKKSESGKKRTLESKGDRTWLKFMLLGAVMVIILAGIIYGSIYAVKSLASLTGNETTNQTGIPEGVEEAANKTLQEEGLQGGAPDGEGETPEDDGKISYEKVFVKKGSETQIPLRIYNANETATFRIMMNDNISWIKIDEREVEIEPNTSRVIDIIASPNESVMDGNYRLSVDIAVPGQRDRFTKGFTLQVRENRFSAAWSYLLYALAGIIVLSLIIAVLRKRGGKTAGEAEKVKEPKPKKKGSKGSKKTDINLK